MAPLQDVEDVDDPNSLSTSAGGEAGRDTEPAELAELNDEAQDAEEERAAGEDGWLDLMEGKIRKRVLSKGTGMRPEMKQDVRCSFHVWLADEAEAGEAAGAALQHRREVRFRIGEAEAVPMLELGLRHMRQGETAELFGVANMAWGPAGCKAAGPEERDVPPNAAIRMRVVLHECLLMPTGDPSWNFRVQELNWRKESGNDHFRRRDFQKARRAYAAGLEVFQEGFDPPVEFHHKAAAGAMVASVAADVGANLAAVYLELGDNVAARDAVEAVLDLKPEHLKALYRKAKACLALDEFDPCEQALQRLLTLEPSNAAARKLQVELKGKRKQYASRSKKAAAGFLQGLAYPERPKKASEENDEDSFWSLSAWTQPVVDAWYVAKENVASLRRWHWGLLAAFMLMLAALAAQLSPASRFQMLAIIAMIIPGPILAVLTTSFKPEAGSGKKQT